MSSETTPASPMSPEREHMSWCPFDGRIHDPEHVCWRDPVTESTQQRITIGDGSSWPRPALESDEKSGVGWVLRYGDPTIGDLLEAAAIIDAYSHLVAESTQAKRDLVCREVRAALDVTSPPGGESDG